MSISKRIIALLLTVCFVFSSVSCNKDESDETTSNQNGYVYGNPDYETECYSSHLLTLPCHTDILLAFPMGDKVCFVSETFENRYGMYVCTYDGQIESEAVLDLPDSWFAPSLCDIDGSRFVAVGEYPYCKVFDYDGNLIKEIDIAPNNDEGGKDVCTTSDGFMVLVGNTVCRFDRDGNLLEDAVNTNDGLMLCAVFEQGGDSFAYARIMDGSSDSDYGYYKIDFENDLFDLVAGEGDLQISLDGANLLAGCYNLFCYYQIGEGFYELNPEEKTKIPLADVNNMLIMPPPFRTDDQSRIKALDKKHFFKEYLYLDKDIEVTDIILISPDDSIHLKDRTPLVIQGVGTSFDNFLQAAAYEYNVSQDEYIIQLDDLENHLQNYEGIGDYIDLKLQLLSEYSNGNTPDMYYGNFFDLNYMGEHGMASDLSDYLQGYRYDKMKRDGELYQIFAGYALYGYFGRDDVYDNDVSWSDMPDIPDDRLRFGQQRTDFIVDNLIGDSLYEIYLSGELTYDHVFDVLEEALNDGHGPNEYPAYGMETTNVGQGIYSLLHIDYLGSPDTYANVMQGFGDYPVFVGYPSVNGSYHLVEPKTLIAVSSSTPNIEACCDFIATLMSPEIQRKVFAYGYIPSDGDVLMECMEVIKHPDTATDYQKLFFADEFIHDYSAREPYPVIPMSDELADMFLAQTELIDGVRVIDYQIMQITEDEVFSYYTQGKSVEEVADALYSRYLVYAHENYG